MPIVSYSILVGRRRWGRVVVVCWRSWTSSRRHCGLAQAEQLDLEILAACSGFCRASHHSDHTAFFIVLWRAKILPLVQNRQLRRQLLRFNDQTQRLFLTD
jgi:hypothetical protein